MRKVILAAAAAVALVAVVPAGASADEPLACKIVNGVSQKTTGEDILICLDDPTNDPW